MPRAKSICLRGGCVSPTVRDGRCTEHQLRKSWSGTSARNMNRPSDWKGRRSRVLARDRFRCQSCGARERLEVDHLVPVSRGGSWELDNLWTLCKSCHARKSAAEKAAPGE